ncbi:hypothetical protein WJX82_010726 [Trebouxia sp. C0006]
MVATSLEIVGIVLAALGGIALAVQAGVNSSLGRNVGKGLAGIISFSSGLFFLLIYFLISTYGAKAQGPTVAGFRETPWYSYIGGFLGAYYVLIVILFAQQLGNGTLTGIAVTAQLVTAIFLDGFGWVGFVKRQVLWPRIVGDPRNSCFHGFFPQKAQSLYTCSCTA